MKKRISHVGKRILEGSQSNTPRAKLAKVVTTQVMLLAKCQDCTFSLQEDAPTSIENFGRSVNVVKQFIKKARAHTGRTRHSVATTIVDRRVYTYDQDRAARLTGA